jgi:radical SAM protein with 4Fe4S-binding SPASM domain
MESMRAHFKTPLYLAWEVTLRCNAECLHCYSASGPTVPSNGETSTSEALSIIDDLAAGGLLILAFSGGEPLLRKDIFQLIHRAVTKQLIVNIATNGAIVTRALAARLKDSGVQSVTVSLDGADAATHEAMRKRSGLFSQALRAMDLLAAADLRVVVSFTPTSLNYQQGPAVVELALRHGASAVNMSEYVPAGRGTKELALPPMALRDVVNQWIQMRRDYAGRIQIIWHDCRVALLVPPEERDRYMGCGAGRLTARLRVDGTLTPCVFLPNSAGDLRRERFADVWRNSPVLTTIRNREALHSGNCAQCESKAVCGGCRAYSNAYYSDMMRGDPSCWVRPERTALSLPVV